MCFRVGVGSATSLSQGTARRSGYCANHPKRRPERDTIPIGPITRHAGDSITSNAREFWKPSPDSEEIRQHLLDMLDDFSTHVASDWYPAPAGLGEMVLWQLGQFKEQRALERLEWISENGSKYLAKVARTALAKIREED